MPTNYYNFFSKSIILICLTALVFGCEQPNKLTHTNGNKGPVIRIEQNEDTVAFAERVLKYVVQNTDVGFMANSYCDTFYKVPIEEFKPERYFTIFEKDSGTATCGLAGQLMVKILLQNGIDAYTYNFGFKGVLTHVVVLVKHKGQLLIFDPFMNYALLNRFGNHIGLVALLDDISKDSLLLSFSDDTLISEFVVNFQQLPEKYKKTLTSEACNEFRTNWTTVRDSTLKKPFYRCYSCERDRACASFVRNFETELSEVTRMTRFHEGFALKINQIYGAADYLNINAEIDSIIANSMGIQNRISLK